MAKTKVYIPFDRSNVKGINDSCDQMRKEGKKAVILFGRDDLIGSILTDTDEPSEIYTCRGPNAPDTEERKAERLAHNLEAERKRREGHDADFRYMAREEQNRILRAMAVHSTD